MAQTMTIPDSPVTLLDQNERVAWDRYLITAAGLAHLAHAGVNDGATFDRMLNQFEVDYQAWRDIAARMGVFLAPWEPRAQSRLLRRPEAVTEALSGRDV